MHSYELGQKNGGGTRLAHNLLRIPQEKTGAQHAQSDICGGNPGRGGDDGVRIDPRLLGADHGLAQSPEVDRSQDQKHQDCKSDADPDAIITTPTRVATANIRLCMLRPHFLLRDTQQVVRQTRIPALFLPNSPECMCERGKRIGFLERQDRRFRLTLLDQKTRT